MKEIGILLSLCLPTLTLSEILYLDAQLINKEIVHIMRSRGIDPEPAKTRMIAATLSSLCDGSQVRRSFARNLSFKLLPKRDYLSIAELYQLAFSYLMIGRLYDAVQIWQHIALSDPQTEEEKSYVNASMELCTIQVQYPTYPFVRIPLRKSKADSDYIVVPPISTSVLVASLID